MKFPQPLIIAAGISVTASFLAIGTVIRISQKGSAYDGFLAQVLQCNSAETRLRFSCYRSAIEKNYRGNLRGLLERVGGDKNLALDSAFGNGADISYANFGTNCHTFYHAVGDFIATTATSTDVRSALANCPATCTSGCTMGLFKRTALQNRFSTDTLKEFYPACREGENHQCAHEIGHLLHDKYSYSILKILDELSEKYYALKPAAIYRYSADSGNNLNAPFEECKKLVPEKEWPYCFTGIGHNLFLFSEFSPDGYRSVFRECEKVDPSNRDSCSAFLIYRIGINEAAPRFLSNRFEEGKSVCDDVAAITGRPDLSYHCYIGLGGGIGLFADSEYSLWEVTDENIAEIKSELIELANLCQHSKAAFIDNCFAGLLGTKFLKLYKTVGAYHDRIEALLPKLDLGFQVVG